MNKVGLFGGNFNPIHNGHINCVFSVLKELNLDHIFVIPNEQSPGKPVVEGADAADRLEMARIAFNDYADAITIDEQEIERGGISYTIDTLEKYAEDFSPRELHLIVGLDAFLSFDKWKEFEKILELTNLVVVSRPSFERPFAVDELPAGLQPLVEKFAKDKVIFKSGTFAQFFKLEDVEVSATEIRKKLRLGQKVDKFLPVEVERYIRENKLYRPADEKVGNYNEFTAHCAKFLNDKGGIAVRAFDLTNIDAPSSYSLICSGTSTRHTTAMAENLIKTIKDEYGLLPLSLEGAGEGRWVLVDYGSLIVHVFYDYVRQDYSLEELWKRGKEISLSLPK